MLVHASLTSSAATGLAKPSHVIPHVPPPATDAPAALTATASPHARQVNTAAAEHAKPHPAPPAGAHATPAAAHTQSHTLTLMVANSAALTSMRGTGNCALIGLMPTTLVRQTAMRVGNLALVDRVYQLENHAPHEKIQH